MKKVELQDVQHSVKVGDVCPTLAPNIIEDTIFTHEGKAVGFYLRSVPTKMGKVADVANSELRSKRVPKSEMRRSSGMHGEGAEVRQYSTIIGSVPPKPHMRRDYMTRSSVHRIKSAQTFIKAMLLLCREAESVIEEIMPEQYQHQKKLMEAVPERWRLGNLFTSSISNYNIPAAYHRDAGNIIGASNVIITKRGNSKGGNLHIPDHGAVIDQCDNSMLFYPAWRNVHGVTPIEPTHPEGYRNSLVFYPLKAFVNA